MTKAGILSDSSSAAADVEFLVGNSGGAVGPDSSFQIYVLGAGGITVTGDPGTNTLTISGDIVTGVTNVNTSPYVVLTSDEYLSVDCSGGAITIQLPNTNTDGRKYVIKDRTGSASSFNITVSTVGGVVNIDGATSQLIVNPYDALEVIWNNTTGAYEVF